MCTCALTCAMPTLHFKPSEAAPVNLTEEKGILLNALPCNVSKIPNQHKGIKFLFMNFQSCRVIKKKKPKNLYIFFKTYR